MKHTLISSALVLAALAIIIPAHSLAQSSRADDLLNRNAEREADLNTRRDRDEATANRELIAVYREMKRLEEAWQTRYLPSVKAASQEAAVAVFAVGQQLVDIEDRLLAINDVLTGAGIPIARTRQQIMPALQAAGVDTDAVSAFDYQEKLDVFRRCLRGVPGNVICTGFRIPPSGAAPVGGLVPFSESVPGAPGYVPEEYRSTRVRLAHFLVRPQARLSDGFNPTAQPPTTGTGIDNIGGPTAFIPALSRSMNSFSSGMYVGGTMMPGFDLALSLTLVRDGGNNGLDNYDALQELHEELDTRFGVTEAQMDILETWDTPVGADCMNPNTMNPMICYVHSPEILDTMVAVQNAKFRNEIDLARRHVAVMQSAIRAYVHDALEAIEFVRITGERFSPGTGFDPSDGQ